MCLLHVLSALRFWDSVYQRPSAGRICVLCFPVFYFVSPCASCPAPLFVLVFTPFWPSPVPQPNCITQTFYSLLCLCLSVRSSNVLCWCCHADPGFIEGCGWWWVSVTCLLPANRVACLGLGITGPAHILLMFVIFRSKSEFFWRAVAKRFVGSAKIFKTFFFFGMLGKYIISGSLEHFYYLKKIDLII